MTTPEQRSNPEAEKIKVLQTRLDDLYNKFGIDPNEEVDEKSLNFMLIDMEGRKEWLQASLYLLKSLIKDVSLGHVDYKEADADLKEWEKKDASNVFYELKK